MDAITRARFDALEARSAALELRMQALDTQLRTQAHIVEAEQNERLDLDSRLADVEARVFPVTPAAQAAPAAPADLPATHRTLMDAPLHKSPARDAEIFAQIGRSALLVEIGRVVGDEPWYGVRVRGTALTGWIEAQFVEPIP